MRYYYNPLDATLIDENGNTVYREDGIGEIDLRDVVAGTETWTDGTEFTVGDFIREILELPYDGLI